MRTRSPSCTGHPRWRCMHLGRPAHDLAVQRMHLALEQIPQTVCATLLLRHDLFDHVQRFCPACSSTVCLYLRQVLKAAPMATLTCAIGADAFEVTRSVSLLTGTFCMRSRTARGAARAVVPAGPVRIGNEVLEFHHSIQVIVEFGSTDSLAAARRNALRCGCRNRRLRFQHPGLLYRRQPRTRMRMPLPLPM